MPFVNRYNCLLIFIVLASFTLKAGQIPYLERTVTVHINSRSLSEVFKIISAQTSVVFSYSQAFNDKQKVTLNCNKKPLRLVMNELLKETGCTYKIKDKFIILKCDANPLPPPSVITGYIYNAEDSSVVANASIYVKQTRHSAQSNEYGFFSLSYSNKLPSISVSFARENYYDSTLVIYNQSKQEVVLYLYPLYQKKTNDTIIETIPFPEKDSIILITKNDTLALPQRRFFSSFWAPLKTVNTNLKNISDTLFSNIALSFVPYVSTNRLLSINTVNKISFNILAGYSKGVDVFELAGLMNIDNGNVRYAQIAGAVNIVSGNVSGAQVAGVLNFNNKDTKGAQLAGVINVDDGSMSGVAIAGIGNVTSENTKGVQLSGVFNATSGRMEGAQITGICNSTSSVKGLQIAGIVNAADTVKGFQLSGINNAAGQMRGMQLCGLINRASNLKGVQLGLINIADTSSGISIGLFNYVKTGYHKIEVGIDELLFGNIAFGTGTEKFYTIFTGGVNIAKPTVITYGYGVGTGFTIKNKSGLCFNITAQQIQSTSDSLYRSNLLAKAYLGFEYKFHPKFRISVGPTFNVYSANLADILYPDLLPELPTSYRMTESNTTAGIKLWVGARLSLKFF